MGATNFECSINTAALLLRDGVKDIATVNICKVDTGSYVYKAYMLINSNRDTDIRVSKSEKVIDSNGNKHLRELCVTPVRVSGYGIDYDNQNGNITIPASVSKQLVAFARKLNFKLYKTA